MSGSASPGHCARRCHLESGAGERALRTAGRRLRRCAARRSMRAPTWTPVSRGVGELRNVSAHLTLDPALLPQLPPRPTRHRHGQARTARAGAGSRAARHRRHDRAARFSPGGCAAHGARLLPGDIRRQRRRPDGALVGKLRDLGGPFAVDGTITLTPPNNYVVQGFITGRTRRCGAAGARDHARRDAGCLGTQRVLVRRILLATDSRLRATRRAAGNTGRRAPAPDPARAPGARSVGAGRRSARLRNREMPRGRRPRAGWS